MARRALVMAELGHVWHGLDARMRGPIAARAARATRACGCTAASVALLLSSCAAVGWWLWRRGDGAVPWAESEVALLLIVGITLAAKLAAVATAYVWLRVTLWRLRAITAALPASKRAMGTRNGEHET